MQDYKSGKPYSLGLQIPIGMEDEKSIRDTDWRCWSRVLGAIT